MELRTDSGQLKAGGAFKLIATGYLLGAGVIFIPAFVVMGLVATLAGAPIVVNGQVVEGGFATVAGLAPLFLLPVILAGQAMVLSGIIVLGLWLYTRWRPIRVTAGDASE